MKEGSDEEASKTSYNHQHEDEAHLRLHQQVTDHPRHGHDDHDHQSDVSTRTTPSHNISSVSGTLDNPARASSSQPHPGLDDHAHSHSVHEHDNPHPYDYARGPLG